MDFKPGGILNPGEAFYQNTHPWKTEAFLPLSPTPEQLEQAALIKTFQDDIELLDTSFLDD
ncbi:hypothetical protein [Streptomyces sp. enrichment culture]|uniref:hypothetical protein n=1 Tax=Streptomyces sp. enrichment culture TaxID=1795815 RepID=UPI003F558566